MSDFLTTEQIAEARRWHRTTAWRWLQSLQPEMVTRRGRKIGMTSAQFEAAMRAERPPIDERIQRRLADIEERIRIIEGRQDRAANDVRDLKRAVNGPMF